MNFQLFISMLILTKKTISDAAPTGNMDSQTVATLIDNFTTTGIEKNHLNNTANWNENHAIHAPVVKRSGVVLTIKSSIVTNITTNGTTNSSAQVGPRSFRYYLVGDDNGNNIRGNLQDDHFIYPDTLNDTDEFDKTWDNYEKALIKSLNSTKRKELTNFFFTSLEEDGPHVHADVAKSAMGGFLVIGIFAICLALAMVLSSKQRPNNKRLPNHTLPYFDDTLEDTYINTPLVTKQVTKNKNDYFQV